MISTSFKETSDIYKMPPSLLPANPTLENFIEGWKGADFGMFFQNSAVVTFLATIGTVFSSSVVAYGFARFKSRLSPVSYTHLDVYKRQGLRVPEDISVMGIDGIFTRNHFKPKLTTMSIYPERQGAKCVEVLIDMLEGKKYKYMNYSPYGILEGETVKDLK